jgi:DNA mismatch repair protein MutL
MTSAVDGSIRVLSPEVASRIAAGEVIERPVSVVRELLDNALDAGATRVSIEIEEGGLKLIRVTDNGRGILPGDLELAFERHATSKLSSIDDLRGLRTLGFRGEALPSIAAAADVEVLTRAQSEPVGVQVYFVESRVVKRQARAAPPGTSFAARELFGRVPARRKFLSAPPQESRHITTLVSHYALAYPSVAFHLLSARRSVLQTPGDGDLRHAFAAIYGADQASQMLDVEFEEDGIRIHGLAGPPTLTRGNRSAISTFVNGRWVQSRSLGFAVVDAYQSQLPVGRAPVAAVDIRIDEDDVDVNVHPAKAEVRFRDERAVGRALRRAIRAALEGAPAATWIDRAIDPGAESSHGHADRPVTFGGDAPRPTLLRARVEPSPALRGPQPVQVGLDPSHRPAPEAPASSPQPGTHREVLPLLRVVGQMNLTYIVAEGPGGMYLIDQHAAHERVRYEQVTSQRREVRDRARQPLLEPVLLELDMLQAAVLDENVERLAALGLAVESFGQREYLVRSVPAGFAASDIAGAIRAFIDQLANETRVQDPFARAVATVACHSSVRAGQALSLEEMRRLVEDLEQTETPRTCPHGRPTLVHVATDSIERQFGRR